MDRNLEMPVSSLPRGGGVGVTCLLGSESVSSIIVAAEQLLDKSKNS